MFSTGTAGPSREKDEDMNDTVTYYWIFVMHNNMPFH